jgi:protein involved in temperature-dependent protein secretion
MLFQPMVPSGQWDRALTSPTSSGMDPESDDLVRTYRVVVRCELFRKEVFAAARRRSCWASRG